MHAKDIAAYVLLASIWGTSFVVMMRVNNAFGWAGTVAFRCFIAAGAVFVAALLTRRRLRFTAAWRHYAVVGLATVAGQLTGFTYATPRIGTAMAAVFAAVIPLASIIVGWLWKLETITAQKLAGLLLGLAGIVLLVGFPPVEGTGTFITGCLFGMLGALSSAVGSCYTSVYLRNESRLEITIASFFVGGLVTLPLVYFVPVPGVPSAADYGNLLFLGAVMSGIAYLLFFRLVGAIGPTRTNTVEFLVTVIAVFVGTCLLGESLTVMQITGGLVIVAGCALVLDIPSLILGKGGSGK